MVEFFEVRTISAKSVVYKIDEKRRFYLLPRLKVRKWNMNFLLINYVCHVTCEDFEYRVALPDCLQHKQGQRDREQ